MRLYISGPMTGYKNFNYPAFDAKRDELLAQGHDVVSPADLGRQAGIDEYTQVFTPDDLKEAARRDVEAVIDTDGLVLLEGWEGSRGACAEKAIADWLRHPVFYPNETVQPPKFS